jgi:hypothetical protein
MLITDTLDVGIGLALVYLLVSLAMTSLSEAIEGFLKKRAVDLERAISEMLQGDTKALNAFYGHPLISALFQGNYKERKEVPAKVDPSGTVKKDAHPAARWRGRNLPSYIPRDMFSAVLAELHEKGEVNDRIQQAIGTLTRASGFDPAATRKGIENWYDNAMDRAAGWYKRRTQTRLFWMGLLVAVLANMNSVTIANYLAHAPEARKAVVQIATDATTNAPGWLKAGQDAEDAKNIATPPAATEAPRTAIDNGTDGNATDGNVVEAPQSAGTTPVATATPAKPSARSDPAKQIAYYNDYKNQLEKVGLPIGWSEASKNQTLAEFKGADGGKWLLAAFLLVAGYLCTAFAIMLGAPFWFDLLGKLIVIRSTVKPKEKSPDEASKDAHGGGAKPGTPAAGGGTTAPDSALASATPGDGSGEGGGEQLVYG